MSPSQYQVITDFHRRVFPNATPLSCAKHLLEEADELKDNPTDKSEIADCFLLLFGVCQTQGLSYQQVFQLIDAKLQICEKRTWEYDSDLGYSKHI